MLRAQNSAATISLKCGKFTKSNICLELKGEKNRNPFELSSRGIGLENEAGGVGGAGGRVG